MRKQDTLLRTAMLALITSLCSTAAIAALPNIACTGTQTFNALQNVSITCVGQLSISGGELTSDQSISISSTESVMLNDLVLASPSIHVSSEFISISPSVSLLSDSLKIESLYPTQFIPPAIGDGETLNGEASIVSSIPEPSSATLLAFGLLALTSFRRNRKALRE